MKEEKESDLDEKEVSHYKNRLAEAKKVFKASVSDYVVYLSILHNVPLPDRVAGHDYGRDSEQCFGQQGSGKAASDHGNNQANQYKIWKDKVLAACGNNQHVEKYSAKEFVKRVDQQNRVPSLSISIPKKVSAGGSHSPNSQLAAAEKKKNKKADQSDKKHELWVAKQRAEFPNFNAK